MAMMTVRAENRVSLAGSAWAVGVPQFLEEPTAPSQGVAGGRGQDDALEHRCDGGELRGRQRPGGRGNGSVHADHRRRQGEGLGQVHAP